MVETWEQGIGRAVGLENGKITVSTMNRKQRPGAGSESRLQTLKAYLSWCASSRKAASSPQTVPPTEDEIVKYQNPWRAFSFKLPQLQSQIMCQKANKD